MASASLQPYSEFRGRIILIRAMPDSLRAVRHCIFTGGVVEESGICSAGFLRKHPRCGKRPNPLRLLTAFASTSPKGRGSGETVHFALELETLRGLPRALPLGELSPQVTERARLLTERARTFAANTPTVKTGHVALKPGTFPPCQGLPPRGSWLCAAKTEGVFVPHFPAKTHKSLSKRIKLRYSIGICISIEK